jgi:hypothetical protein
MATPQRHTMVLLRLWPTMAALTRVLRSTRIFAQAWSWIIKDFAVICSPLHFALRVSPGSHIDADEHIFFELSNRPTLFPNRFFQALMIAISFAMDFAQE